ncbi:MAG TPA: hypothetical protein VGK43_02695 [Solirubrobacterales bacterium]
MTGRPCIPTERDRRSYHYPPKPLTCPRCESWPFEPDDGCEYCGLGRAYPVPPGLDPVCDVAQGWASGWANGSPPTADQVDDFTKRHGARCQVCWRYRRWWKRPIHALRRRLREAALPNPDERST